MTDWCDSCGKELKSRTEGSVLQGQGDKIFCKKCSSKILSGEK